MQQIGTKGLFYRSQALRALWDTSWKLEGKFQEILNGLSEGFKYSTASPSLDKTNKHCIIYTTGDDLSDNMKDLVKQTKAQYLDRCRDWTVRLYTLQEVSQLLRIAPQTLRLLIWKHKDKVRPIKTKGRLYSRSYFTDEDVKTLLQLQYPVMTEEQKRCLYRRLRK